MKTQITRIGRVTKVEIDVIRPNNKKETVELTEKFKSGFPVGTFRTIQRSTEEAGKGEVVEARITHVLNNTKELEKNWNNLHNEGGEGFTPNFDENSKGYKEWEEVITYK